MTMDEFITERREKEKARKRIEDEYKKMKEKEYWKEMNKKVRENDNAERKERWKERAKKFSESANYYGGRFAKGMSRAQRRPSATYTNEIFGGGIFEQPAQPRRSYSDTSILGGGNIFGDAFKMRGPAAPRRKRRRSRKRYDNGMW